MLTFNNEGSTCLVCGELSQQAVIAHWPEVEQLLTSDVSQLNLSGITYADTAGVALLLQLMAQQRQGGGSLTLSQAPLQLQKLIDLYDLQDFFVEEAN